MRIMSIMSRCLFSFNSSHHVYHLILDISVQANQAFAARLASVLQPGDLVWVHDYHLLLVPRMLRNAMHSGAVNGMGGENNGDV